MKKNIRIVFFLWSFMSAGTICILLIFESKRCFNYCLNDYRKSKMLVTEIEDVSNSGRRNGIVVSGKLNNENVYFSLNGDERTNFYNYLKDIPDKAREKSRELNYKDMDNLNLIVPIIKFKNSRNVLLISKGSSLEKTIKSWSNKKIIIIIIAFFPLLIFPLIKKHLL